MQINPTMMAGKYAYAGGAGSARRHQLAVGAITAWTRAGGVQVQAAGTRAGPAKALPWGPAE